MSPRKGKETESPATGTISTRRQAAKRQAEETEKEKSDPKSKRAKKVEVEEPEPIEQPHADLLHVVHESDLTSVVSEVETQGSVLPPQIFDFGTDDDEDDVAAELPDGFCSTSSKSFLNYKCIA
jgi:hypothetical protein